MSLVPGPKIILYEKQKLGKEKKSNKLIQLIKRLGVAQCPTPSRNYTALESIAKNKVKIYLVHHLYQHCQRIFLSRLVPFLE